MADPIDTALDAPPETTLLHWNDDGLLSLPVIGGPSEAASLVLYQRADFAAAREADLRARCETLDALYARCNNDFLAMSADRDRLMVDNADLRAEVERLRNVLRRLLAASINDMTARGFPPEWFDRSPVGEAFAALGVKTDRLTPEARAVLGDDEWIDATDGAKLVSNHPRAATIEGKKGSSDA